MGSDESLFCASLIVTVRDSVPRQCPQTTTCEGRGQLKWNRTMVLLLTTRPGQLTRVSCVYAVYSIHEEFVWSREPKGRTKKQADKLNKTTYVNNRQSLVHVCAVDSITHFLTKLLHTQTCNISSRWREDIICPGCITLFCNCLFKKHSTKRRRGVGERERHTHTNTHILYTYPELFNLSVSFWLCAINLS